MAVFDKTRDGQDGNMWTSYFDGAFNALGHGIRALLLSPDNQRIPMTVRLCFSCTNNVAEYEACATGIRAAIEFRVRSMNIFGDSALVIHQLNGEWETRDQKLIPY